MARKLYNFYIDPELAAGLKALKEKTGAPEGESVRRAIAEYLKKHRVGRPRTSASARAARPRKSR